MKQVISLDLSCNLYKNFPRAKLFFDNKLIDEFTITNNIDTGSEKQWYQRRSLPYKRDEVTTFFLNNLRQYVIDDFGKKQVSLHIEINNDDNNFVENNHKIDENFKSTLIICKWISIHPINFFLHPEKIVNRIHKLKSLQTKTAKIKKFYFKHKLGYHLLDGLTFKNTANNINYPARYTVGGSGFYKILLNKKHGFWNCEKLPSETLCGILGHLNIADMQNLKDYYETVTNIRNTDKDI